MVFAPLPSDIARGSTPILAQQSNHRSRVLRLTLKIELGI